jgi:hypothetical protein
MPRKPKLDHRGLRERRWWPELTEDEQKTIINFLGWYRAVAEDGHAKAVELANMATIDNGTRQNAEWWAYAVRTVDWLLSYVPHRQQYLEILLAEKEGRWKPPATRPGT